MPFWPPRTDFDPFNFDFDTDDPFYQSYTLLFFENRAIFDFNPFKIALNQLFF